MLHCRRCQSDALLELARLEGADHIVYRCRACGFLFSPPADAPGNDPAGGGGVTPAAPPLAGPELARRRLREAAAIRNRRNPGAGAYR